MQRLTQCLIVKNEERNLPRALQWGKGLVDELIVVDTGSTDGTVALAEGLGARVLRFEWINDFSAARNFAISQCTGNWIFFLDADEYFEDTDVALLRPLIEKISGQYIHIKGKKIRYNVLETPWINVANGSVTRQSRIFRNVPYLRYSGAVHEKLRALPGGNLAVYPVKDSPLIYHTGYVWSADNSKAEKGTRNFAAAKKALEESPDCALLELYAAEALTIEGKLAQAEGYFSRALKNSDGSISQERAREGYRQWLSLYLRMEQAGADALTSLSSAVRAHYEAVMRFPDEPDYDILISQLYFKAKDVENTVRYFSSSMSKKGDGKITGRLMASNSEAYERLRDASEKLNRK